jgi:hypothetical protein
VKTSEAVVAIEVAELLSRELDEDYVGLWTVPWHLRRRLSGVSDETVRMIAETILRGLVESGLCVGELSESTGVFEPWPSSSGIDRAMQEWQALGRDPNIGEIAWVVRKR